MATYRQPSVLPQAQQPLQPQPQATPMPPVPITTRVSSGLSGLPPVQSVSTVGVNQQRQAYAQQPQQRMPQAFTTPGAQSQLGVRALSPGMGQGAQASTMLSAPQMPPTQRVAQPLSPPIQTPPQILPQSQPQPQPTSQQQPTPVQQQPSAQPQPSAGSQQLPQPLRTNIPTVENNENDILPRKRLHEIMTQISPTERLDRDILLEMADDFSETVAAAACQLSKHRSSSVLEAKDISLYLDQAYNIRIPGFSVPEQSKTAAHRQASFEAHKQRVAAVKKSAKR